MTGLLFDLGGTFLRAGVADANGTIRCLQKTRILSVADGAGEQLIWERITKSILAFECRHSRNLLPDAPIVVSFPGPIGPGGQVLQAPTVDGASHSAFDLPGALQQATGRPVCVLNDVSAAAWRISEMTDARRFLVVTVSSGIGSKLFDRCHPAKVIDQPPYAGEIGHVVIADTPDAPLCDCGGRGHLGAIASGRGIERMIRRRVLAEPDAFRHSHISRELHNRPSGDITNEEHIVPAFLAGDEWTKEIVTECTRPLVRSLLLVAMAAGLEKIFIMGGFANALGAAYINLLSRLATELSGYAVARHLLPELFEGVTLDHETSLEGCAAFLRSRQRRAA